jgi:glycosyltransferase involved in cell wall biosynthesis
MIVGCVITYNDMPLIKDCIESIYDKVDRIVAIDGRYKDFPGDSWDSTDGTLEYLCSLDKADVISTLGYAEIDKRNRYLEELSDGDICLNLDADEVLIGNISKLDVEFGIIDLADGHSRHVQKRATRFFKYREGMRYKNVHYTLYCQGRQLNSLKKVLQGSFENIDSFHLKHNWYLRDQVRKYHKGLYYKKLIKNEQGFPR